MIQIILKIIITLIILAIAYFAIDKAWRHDIDVFKWFKKPSDIIPVKEPVEKLPGPQKVEQEILEENKKQTVLLEKMQRISETDHEKLIQKYPLGYILFAIKDYQEIIGKQSQQEWEVDWNSARILASDEQKISFMLPTMWSSDGERWIGGNSVTISNKKGVKPVIKAFGVEIYSGILVEDSSSIICIIGLKDYQ